MGVGSVRGKVLVGDLGGYVPPRPCRSTSFGRWLVVAFESPSHYGDASVFTVVAVVVLAFVLVLPGKNCWPAEQWAAGREVDRAKASIAFTACSSRTFRGIVLATCFGRMLLWLSV